MFDRRSDGMFPKRNAARGKDADDIRRANAGRVAFTVRRPGQMQMPQCLAGGFLCVAFGAAIADLPDAVYNSANTTKFISHAIVLNAHKRVP